MDGRLTPNGQCEQKFVRADLLARHRKRHSASYVPRNRVPSFSTTATTTTTATTSSSPGSAGAASTPAAISPTAASASASSSANEPRPAVTRAPHDAAILLAPDSTRQQAPSLPNPAPSGMAHHTNWHPQVSDLAACNMVRPKAAYYPGDDSRVPPQPAPVPFHPPSFQHDDVSRDYFAMWLFNPDATQSDFSSIQLPFMDGGLESTFNNSIRYDYESLTSGRSQLDTPTRFAETDELISEFRRQEILRWFEVFRRKHPKSEPLVANIIQDSNGDIPALSVEMMRDCLQEYWEHVSPRLPIVHKPTFSCNRCSIFLLMVMVALGAASLRARDSTGNLADYGGFADIIILGARSEIQNAEEAWPPVSLWVSQALLLLEFYEKMYSSRRLHERAHIYHSAALTLLRRGSPLIGRGGSESPPEVPSADQPQAVSLDSYTWWCRWAETESMHRVVFAAFMMDIIHAAMFGHAADMAPHEIRLPLPCDETLWTASNPDIVRQFDQNFRMYGVRTISFLDGLKRALHGEEVKTHAFGRMIIMSGLLSVGWHLSHRETHLKWLDLTAPPAEKQEAWKATLLSAFDHWKNSFDAARGVAGSPGFADASPHLSGSSGPIHSSAVLYHLAQISLHVDIIDCQVYAGAKRLLGRKVSSRDYANVVARMRIWATLPSTRHAVLHAFRLLHRVLVDPRRNGALAERDRLDLGAGGVSLPPIEVPPYSCRNEPDPHRPWVMYYAALCIWSFVRAIGHQEPHQESSIQAHVAFRQVRHPPLVNYHRVSTYLSSVANLSELDDTTAAGLADGLPDLLDALRAIFSEAHSELLQEAHERLRVCKEMLVGGAG